MCLKFKKTIDNRAENFKLEFNFEITIFFIFSGRIRVFFAQDPHPLLQHRRDLQPLRQGRQTLPRNIPKTPQPAPWRGRQGSWRPPTSTQPPPPSSSQRSIYSRQI